MKYLKRITTKEVDDALKKAYGKLTVEEFWDVRGLIAKDGDFCYATKDDSCFYVYQKDVDNFVYFALEHKVQNIKGLYEVLLDLVYNGIPYIHFNGRKGRYDIIKKSFLHVFEDNRAEKRDDWDFLVIYAAFPENIIRFVERINR